MKHSELCKTPLEVVFQQRLTNTFDDVTIRWCPECGAVVGDLDQNEAQQTKNGKRFPMKFPKLAGQEAARRLLMGEKKVDELSDAAKEALWGYFQARAGENGENG